MPWLWSLLRGRVHRYFRPHHIRPSIDQLEDRLAPAVVAYAPLPDRSFYAYAEQFHGGVSVAVGDVTGDGVADIVTGAGAGGGPNVKVFDGQTGAEARSFYAYDPSFTGGVNVAVGDGLIVTGAGAGGSPHVKAFDAVSGREVMNFYAYDPSFHGGVNVTVGDGLIVTGAGAGGGPHVKAFDEQTGQEVRSFYAFDPAFGGGVSVAIGGGQIITGAGVGGGPHVKVFNETTDAVTQSFYAYEQAFGGGVNVAAGDMNGDGIPDIVTGARASGGPRVRAFDAASGTELLNFYAYDEAFGGGANVAAGGGTLVTGAGPGGGPHVKQFTGLDAGLSTTGNFPPDLAGWDPIITGGSDGGRGSIDVVDGIVTMREGDSFRVGLSKAFTVPATPTAVRVTFESPAFDTASIGRIKDAFEIAVLGADGSPLALPFATGRDASFNWTEQLASVTSTDTTFAAGMMVSRVTINLSALPVGTAAKMVLRLVNDDTDQGTSVRIRRVDFVSAVGTAPAGVTPTPDRVKAATAPDFSTLDDVTPSALLDYGRTTLTDEKTVLTTDMRVRNAGTYALAGRVVVALGNLSDPSVGVLDPDGYTADGRPFFDFTPELNGTMLLPGRMSAARTLRFTNPNLERFTFDTQVLAGLDRNPVFTTEPVTLVQAGKAYQYPARAADADGQALSYSLVGGPAGMTVNPTTGDVSWATTAGDLGNHAVRLRVRDPLGGTAEQTFTLGVRTDIQNRPPVITSNPPTDATIAGAWEVNTLAVGDGTTGIAVADFGTGQRTLVSVNAGDQTLSVLRGTGTGKFGAVTSQRVGEPLPSGRLFRTGSVIDIGLTATFRGGQDAQAITGFTQDDFNGDGTPDLVTSLFTQVYNSATPGGYTFSNFVTVEVSNADGSFAPPVALPYTSTTNNNETNFGIGIVTGDFNGDGKQDLLGLYANSSQGNTSGPNNLLFWKGHGDGSFDALSMADTGTTLATIYTADFDGDGKLDLLAEKTSYNQWGILKGNGDGTFAPYTEFVNTPGAGYYNRIGIGDVDGKNGTDVVLCDYNNARLDVFLNDGSGNLSKSMTLATNVTGGNGQPFGVVVGDHTGDGKPDIVFWAWSSSSGGGAVGIFKGTGDGVNFTYANANPDGTYFPQVPYNGSLSGPVDLNADGKPDIVLGHAAGERGLVVGLNKGDGTFAFTNYQVAADPTGDSSNTAGEFGVLAGDYNHDGMIDLAVMTSHDRFPSSHASVTVIYADAPGVFASPVAVTTGIRSIYGGGPNLTLIGDVNNDGNPDLLTGDNAHFYTNLGNGDGTFDAPGIATPYYNSPQDGFLADLNRDGRLDLVWTGGLNGQNQSSGYGAALGNGDGTFNITYVQDAGNFYGATVITPGDFNGDGYTDFAAFNPAIYAPGTGTFLNGFYDVFLYQPAAPGTFARSYHKIIPVGAADDDGTRRSFTVGDFDGDGNLDLVSIFPRVNTTPMQLLFFKGNGDGTFADPTSTPAFGANSDSQFPKWLATGDLNGDGKLDLVATNAYNRMAVLLGNGNGTFDTPTEYSTGVTFSTGRQVYLTDIDGDGHLDFVGIDNRFGSSGVHIIAVRHGIGDGTFGPEELYNSPSNTNYLGVGDVDRDSVPDVVAATFNYGGGFSVVFTGVKPGLTAVTTGDVTGDGKRDVIATNFANNRVKILAGNGNNTFTRQPDILVGRGPVAVATFDIDADSKLDIVTANRSGKSVTVLHGTGGGAFTRTDISVGSSLVALAVGDLSGDGKPDLLVADDRTNAGYLLVNTGSGFAAPVAIPLGEKPNAVTIADVTGDGKADAVFTLPGSKRVIILPGNGNGTFGSPVYISLASAAGGIAAADFNQDGKTDLAVTLPSDGTVALFFARGAGLFSRPQVVRVGEEPTAITLQDVDGDGRTDLLVANKGDGTASVILNKFDPTKLYRYTVTAFDPDGDPVTFDLPNAPGGMVINPTTGEIVWAPTADQLGLNPVTIQVSDGRGGTATQSFGISVSPTRTNNAPVFTSAPNPTLDSSVPFTYSAKATDTDGDTLRYRLVSGPTGATIDPLTGVVKWDPRNDSLQMNSGVSYSDNGVVYLPDNPSLHTASLTAEGWFRFDSIPVVVSLIHKTRQYDSYTGSQTFSLRLVNGQLRGTVAGFDGNGQLGDNTLDTGWFPQTARWYHLALTFDDASGVLKLFADGRQVGQLVTGRHLSYDDNPILVGYEYGDPLFGAVANVRLWGVARTQAEIQAALAADVASNASGLLVDFRFRDGDAQTIHDWSANGNDGRRSSFSGPWPTRTPGMADPQMQTFTIRVEDGKGGFDFQSFTVNAVAPMRSAITGTVSQTGGGPLGGWVVFVDRNGNGYRDGGEPFATTAANGTYTLPNLLAGDYRLSVEPRAGYVTPTARTVTVAAFVDSVADFAVAPQPLGQIRGTVTTTGPAVPGWVVFLDSNGNTVRDDGETTTTTDAVGNYAFTGLAAGTYTVRFDAPSGWKATAPTTGRVVTLAADGTSTGNDFTVAPADAAGGSRPRFVTTPGTSVVARTTFRYAAVALDPAGRPLTYSLALAPVGMVIDPTSGQISWTPTLTQVGPQQVIVKVSNDASGIDLQAFTVTVSSPNTAPVIASTPPAGALVGVPFRYDLLAQDAEQTTLTFAFDTAPAGAGIDPNTGRIIWTPTAGQLGPQAFIVVVRDGVGGETRRSFSVTATAAGANSAPTTTALPRLTARATIPYSGRITATDPNGDPLSFTLTSGPAGLTLSPDGLISWTPTAAQLGTHTIDVSVSDGRGGTDTHTFSITVGNTLPNAAPIITSTPPAVALAEGLFAYTLTTTDADTDPVAFQLLTAPAGMSLDTVRGTLRWQPAHDQLGPATVSVRAYDPFGGETTQTFTVTVRGADGPPVITSVPPTESVVGTAFLYSVRATDLEGDPLTFSLLEAPAGMMINAVTGELSWTPTAGQVGTPAVIIQVSDGRGGFTTQGFAVKVLAGMPNRPPAFTTEPPLFASVGSLYTFTATATDPDGQPVRYELRSGPTGMSVGASTGEVRWTPVAGQEGTQVVTLAAFDTGGAAGLLSFELSVLAANIPPVITGTAPTFAIAGGTYRYDVTATDANLDPLAYTLVNASAGMTVDAFGRITWRPAVADIGLHTATVRVTDPRGGVAEQTFSLNVRADTSAPRVVVIPGRTVVRATDNDTSARFNLTPDNPSNVVRVAATDDVGVVGLTVTANGKAVVPDERGMLTFHFQDWGFGSIRVVATATDAAENAGTGSKAFAFAPYGFDPDGDTRDPSTLGNTTAVITSPTVGEQTGGFVSIRGSATSDDFTGYTLSFRRVDQTNYATIATGASKVADGVLGKWDTSLLENDEYVLRLEEADEIFGTTVYEVNVGVSGNLKLGNFRLSFADLTIPVAGIPITLARTYDTLRSDRDSDLGFGWRLEYRNTNLQVGLPKSGLEDIGIYTAFKPGAKVYLTLPGGERQGFTFTPDLRALPSFGGQPLVIATPRFTPDRGVTSTLSVGSGSVILNQFNELTTLDGTPWNPASPDFGGGYNLTLADGTRFFIDGTTGLMQTATDRNGNRLMFGDSGITSSSGGVNVSFGRDAKGRIVAVTDPAGNKVHYAYDVKGDLVSVTDRTGNVTRFNYRTDRPHYMDSIIDPLGRTGARTEYDANGRLIGTTDANGHTATVAYDPDAFTLSSVDRTGAETIRQYDDRGNVITEVDPLGITRRFIYDSANRMLSETDAAGGVTRYSYDGLGNTTSVVDQLGHTAHYQYGEFGLMTAEANPLGLVSRTSYDARGNILSVSNALGEATTYAYDATGRLASQTDQRGEVTRYEYDDSGFLVRETGPLGVVTTTSDDANGNVIAETVLVTTAGGPVARTTTYVHDQEGRVIATTDPMGAVTRFEYDAAGFQVAAVDALGRRYVTTDVGTEAPGDYVFPDGRSVRQQFDGEGRTVRTTDAAGRTSQTTLDATGRPTGYTVADGTGVGVSYAADGQSLSVTGPGGGVQMTLDATGRTVAQTDSLGRVTRHEYDDADRETATTDPSGRITRYEYDDADRLVRTIFPDGTSEGREYDAAGNLAAVTDPLGRVTRYEYDSLNRLTAVVTPLGVRTEYTYDEVGELVRQRDANGHITRYEYDPAGRQTAIIRPDGSRTAFVYDAVGRLRSQTDPDGRRVGYEYDLSDRLVTKTLPGGEVVRYTYTASDQRATVTDARGVTRYEYDTRDRLVRRTDPDGTAIAYTYDTAGNLASTTTPAGTTRYTYDQQNELLTVTDPTGGVTRYEYDSAGNLTRTTRPNGTVEVRTYDTNAHLQSVEDRDTGGTVISRFVYVRNADGDPVAVTATDGSTVSYAYDADRRLVSETTTGSSGTHTISYTYDPTGNRLTQTDSTDGQTTYTYDSNDQLLTETRGAQTRQFTYDASGDTKTVTTSSGSVTRFTWDGEHRLIGTQVTDGASTHQTDYVYNADGLRVRSVVDGVDTRYLLDTTLANPQVAVEYAPNGEVRASYVYGLDRLSQTRGGTTGYYLTDGRGSVRAITNVAGGVTDRYDYSAFGRLLTVAGPTVNPFQYRGEATDPITGFQYLRARYYDPLTGRFVSRDPFSGMLESPASRQGYLYGYDNPVSNSDPSGRVTLAEVTVGITIIGFVLAIAQTAIVKARSQVSPIHWSGVFSEYQAGLGLEITFGDLKLQSEPVNYGTFLKGHGHWIQILFGVDRGIALGLVYGDIHMQSPRFTGLSATAFSGGALLLSITKGASKDFGEGHTYLRAGFGVTTNDFSEVEQKRGLALGSGAALTGISVPVSEVYTRPAMPPKPGPHGGGHGH